MILPFTPSLKRTPPGVFYQLWLPAASLPTQSPFALLAMMLLMILSAPLL